MVGFDDLQSFLITQSLHDGVAPSLHLMQRLIKEYHQKSVLGMISTFLIFLSSLKLVDTFQVIHDDIDFLE